MKIKQELIPFKEMIKRLGGDRKAIAEASETTEQHLNNSVSKGQHVVELKNGNFIVARKSAKQYTINK